MTAERINISENYLDSPYIIGILRREGGKTIRRSLVLILVVAILSVPLFSLSSASDDTEGMSGKGTDQDPFLVSSVTDLKNIGKGKYTMNSSYRQTNDIVFTDDDALNKDDVIRLEIKEEGDKILISIFLNDYPFEINGSNNKCAGIVFNDVDLIFPNENLDETNSKYIFEFSEDIYRPYDENIIIVRGFENTYENGFGIAFTFIDLPSTINECLTGNLLPIGTSDNPFNGSYDGQNFFISGVKVVNNSNYKSVGFFGYVENATISNLNIISNEKDKNFSYFITNLFSFGTSTKIDYTSSIGSIVGSMRSTSISSCNNEGIVFSSLIEIRFGGGYFSSFEYLPEATWKTHVGGLVGEGNGNVKNSKNTAAVVSTYSRNRQISGTGVLGCSIEFTLGNKSKMYSDIGGIVGNGDAEISISNSENNGSVSSITSFISNVEIVLFEDVKFSTGYEEFFVGNIGGIIGNIHSGNISNSSNRGIICFKSDILYKVHTTFYENTDISPDGGINIGGLVGFSLGDITIETSSSSNMISISNEYNLLYSGGIVGFVSENLFLMETYYLKNIEFGPSYNGHHEREKYAKLGQNFEIGDYGESWDFERIWDIDDDTGLPVLRLRFYVQFVSDDPSLYDIVFFRAPCDMGYLVDDVTRGFSIELSEMSSRSVPRLHYDDGTPMTFYDGAFMAFLETDDNGTPVDKVVIISGVSINRYSVNAVSLPEDVNMFVIGDSAEHGSSVDVIFSSDTYDVSRLSFTTNSKSTKVLNKGGGVYTVTNVTGDIELRASGFAERPDLTFFIYIVSFTCAVVASAVVFGMIKFIRLKSHTLNDEQTR